MKKNISARKHETRKNIKKINKYIYLEYLITIDKTFINKCSIVYIFVCSIMQ